MTKGLVTTKKIGVLMGGTSAERDVSVRSGLAIYQALQEMGYNSALIDVGKDIVNVLKKEKVRLAFFALHGGLGENGSIQGMLEVMGIRYTGSGVLASAIAMDKETSKKIFSYHGFPVAPHIVVNQKSKAKGKKAAGLSLPEIDFPLPWVIKPASEGSSIGVGIIREEARLAQMLETAFHYGTKVMIEKYIEGKEVHIAVLGNRVLGGVEIRPSLEFYNYEAKYTSGLTEYIIPPEIDETVFENAKDIALRAHNALGCSGASRVDFRIEASGTPYILEVNTLPGMTATSLLPQIARFAGLDFKELIQEILRIAIKEA
jgi:D-alanine-D-alanine ligase